MMHSTKVDTQQDCDLAIGDKLQWIPQVRMQRFVNAIAPIALALIASLSASMPASAQSLLHAFEGDGFMDWFGYSVSGAGDVNADGFADIIVGAYQAVPPGNGRAEVFSGANGAVLHSWTGVSDFAAFGYSVSDAGDVNGDGFADVIVGAPFADSGFGQAGSATVFSGSDGTVLHLFVGDSANDQFGYSVSGAGDVNGDGVPDLIVGAPLDDNNGSASGRVKVFSGLDGSTLYAFDGDSPGDGLGASVSGAGDVNADGFADPIAGAPGSDTNHGDGGSARVYSGFDGSILYTFDGSFTHGALGRSVAGAGDVNGDGKSDLIVGAPNAFPNGGLSGRARVYSGSDGAVLYTFDGSTPGERLGGSVDGAGDLNGDGFDDLVVGTASSLGTNGNVYSGADGSVYFPIPVLPVCAICDPAKVTAVSGAGDVNGDGFDDIITGSPTYSRGVAPIDVELGIAHVYSGIVLPNVFAQQCNGDGGNQLGCTNCPCGNNAPVGSIGGCLNSTLAPGQLELTGSPSVTLPAGSTLDLRASLTGTAPGAFALLVSGAAVAPGNPANPCFGMQSGAQAAIYDGLRCAVMDVRRHGGRVTDTNGEVGVNTPPWGGEGQPQAGLAAQASFIPGQNRYFQAIYRDFANLSCMTGLNTSQSIRVVFQP